MMVHLGVRIVKAKSASVLPKSLGALMHLMESGLWGTEVADIEILVCPCASD